MRPSAGRAIANHSILDATNWRVRSASHYLPTIPIGKQEMESDGYALYGFQYAQSNDSCPRDRTCGKHRMLHPSAGRATASHSIWDTTNWHVPTADRRFSYLPCLLDNKKWKGTVTLYWFSEYPVERFLSEGPDGWEILYASPHPRTSDSKPLHLGCDELTFSYSVAPPIYRTYSTTRNWKGRLRFLRFSGYPICEHNGCVEAPSSMRRDAEAAPKCLFEITCDKKERGYFGKCAWGQRGRKRRERTIKGE